MSGIWTNLAAKHLLKPLFLLNKLNHLLMITHMLNCKEISSEPEKGDLIRASGGVRKIRWYPDGVGKSGGIRVIYYYMNNKRSNLYV